ncbi:hypothetical protein ACO2Q8_26260 [Larkinella sp. VNQ87]|uniref:GAF domain-containing protein n=1 Tax=Larkinella sp. VNQ87 TaxID=3400921 RepID=UPI003C0F4496
METTSTVSSSTAFPVHPVRLSFQPFVGFLKNQQETSLANDALYGLYTYLVDQFERLPDPAGEPLEDILGSKRLTNLFQLASLAVLPMTSTSRDIPYAFGLPMPFTVFHQSAAFQQLLNQFPDLLTELPEQICVEDKLRFLYRLMLEKCYGFTPGNYQVPSFRFQREINGLTRYFQIDVNNAFIEPRSLGVLPTLQPAWIDFGYGTGPLPADPMPMDEFACEGFAFFRIEDITETETMHQLKEVFTHLHSDTEPAIYQQFETALRNLCGEPDFQISIVPFQQVNGYFVHQPEMSARSVILRNSGTVVDGLKDPEIQQQIRMLVDNPAPQLYSDLNDLSDHKRDKLYQKGIRSFMLYPIVSGNEALGIMELASPFPNAFDADVLRKLEQVLPLIQELLRYQLYQFNQTLEQVIKKKFTTLQPAVEWKFREAAWEYVRLGQKEAFNSEATQVRFPQVYPLYGAVDIRNSSHERHKAVCRDFSAQLTAVRDLLSQAHLPDDLALPDQFVAK